MVASLFSIIKEMQLEARKTKRTVAISLLTTLLGEAAMPGKNAGNRESTDAEVIAIIKKFIKNIDASLEALKIEGGEKVMTLQKEKEILEALLPKQLDSVELGYAIMNIMADMVPPPTNKGEVMKVLKEKYEGLYDGKQAATLLGQLGL